MHMKNTGYWTSNTAVVLANRQRNNELHHYDSLLFLFLLELRPLPVFFDLICRYNFLTCKAEEQRDTRQLSQAAPDHANANALTQLALKVATEWTDVGLRCFCSIRRRRTFVGLNRNPVFTD